MNKISNTEYQELRNKLWVDLTGSGVTSNEDEDYKAFDEVLGSHLDVDWSWDEEEGSDICYRCGIAQDYRTMKDVDEGDFAIYCDKCHAVAKVSEELEMFLGALRTNIQVDWDENNPAQEFSTLADNLKVIISNLDKSK